MPRTTRSASTGDSQIVDVFSTVSAPPDPAPVTEPVVVPAPTVAIPTPAPAVARPTPENQLSPEQRRIRDLEDALAKERGKKDSDPVSEQVAADAAEGTLIVHFVEDGFLALGKTWYRGEQRYFDQQSYADTLDRNGASWLDVVDDEQAQITRYGRVMFRRGPWPGKKLTDAVEFQPLAGAAAPTRAELEAAELAENRARLTAPRLPVR